MKFRSIGVLALIGMCVVADAHAQSSMMLASSERVRTVTLSRNGAVLASMTIPPRTFVFVVHDGPSVSPSRSAGGKRWEFHGDIEVYAQSAGNVDRTQGLARSIRSANTRLVGADVDAILVEE